MRARHAVIAFIGLGLTASLACNRTASQQNLIGSKCEVEADCPPELLCVNKACWEPCRPDNTCPNADETCILGACVRGVQQSGGGDSGTQETGMSGSDADSGLPPDGNNKGDGILARANMPSEQVVKTRFDSDDTCVVWIVDVPDGFGNDSLEVHAAPLTTTNAAEHTLATIAPMAGRIAGYACANGYAYWIEAAQGPGTGTLYRRKIDAVPDAENLLTTSDPMGGGNALGHVDDDIFVVDSSDNLRRYDSKTEALDSTSYGSATTGALASRAGTTLYWLYDAGSPPAKPWQLWSAQVGTGGAATTVTLPKPGGPGYLAFGASAASVFVALDVAPKGSLTRVDATSGTTQQVYSASLQAGPEGTPPVAFSGAFGFVNDYSQGGSTAQVMRVNMLDGSKAQIGTSIAPGGARPLRVSATTVYWLEPTTSGDKTVLMKKPKG